MKKDSSLDVTEHILVDFTKDPRRDFYRILPLEYYKSGKKHSYSLRILNVLDERFSPIRHSVAWLGDSVSIRVSKPGKEYIGRHIFRLHYLVRNAFSFANRPELYWQATGDNWTGNIALALVRFVPPANLKLRDLDFAVSRLGQGQSLPAFGAREQNDLIFRADNIEAGSGLDLVIVMPKNSISQPGQLQQLSWFFQDWWLSFFIPLAVLFGLAAVWWICGLRGGMALPRAPKWQLLEHLSPAELGTILDEKCDPGDLVATLIDLATRGYIQIAEIKLDGLLFLSERDYLFTRLRPTSDSRLTKYERMMLEGLFPLDNNQSRLSEVHLSRLKQVLPASKSNLYAMVYAELSNKGQLFQSPQSVRLSCYVTGMALVVIGIVLYIFGALDWQAASLGTALAGIIVFLFSPIMPIRTVGGRQSLKNSLDFFRSYLSKEVVKLQVPSSQESSNRWRFLPYAMVLGLADQWVEAFQDLIKESPSWYKPYYDANGSNFSCRAFVVDLGNAMKTLEKAFGSIVICSFLFSGLTNPAGATGDSTGSTGSVTVTRHVNEAAKAFAARNYAKARDEYRIAIGLSPDTLEFYYGLYDVCIHSGEWDQVAFALDKIFSIDPAKKKQLGPEYGQALYQLGHYEEAIPVLKQALKDADLPMPKISLEVPAPVVEPVAKTDAKPAVTSPVAVATAPAPVVPPRSKETEKFNVSEGSLAQFTKTFQNAAHSESIVIADYLGYDKSPDIQYYHPPLARYHITKILKGPPLNKDLPIRYEFHDRSKAPAPPDWKFGPDKMPAKGSEWIIFIKNAVPREGMFDTYEGSYGRQPSTEDNLNQIYALLENSANR